MSLLYAGRRAHGAWRLPLLALLVAFASPAFGQVVINEIDSDTPAPPDAVTNDDAEFVELYNTGLLPVDLSDYVLVFYNGNGDTSYLSVDLDGFTLLPGDYFVYCADVTVVANCDLAIPGGANTIQNGPDAVGLYTGSTADFPNGTAPTMTNLVDALVYDTNDADDAGLLAGLGETTQYDETIMGNGGSVNAIARQPDGTETFVTQAPTPGVSNGGMGGGAGLLVVTTSADVVATDGLCSLREAVQTANADAISLDCGIAAGADVITFAPTVVDPIVLTMGELDVTNGVTIDGTAAGARVVVDGNAASRVFDVTTDEPVAFSALTMRDGSFTNNGGALHITTGDVTLTDVDVLNSTSTTEGGGIWISGGTLDITGGTIQGNEAQGNDADQGGGGLYNVAADVTLTGVTIRRNRATGTSGSGGGLFSEAETVTLEDVDFIQNTANRAGGGIEIVGGSLTMDTDSRLIQNVAGPMGTANPGNGGGVHVSGAAETTFTGTTVDGNRAAREGGGLWNSATGTMTVDGNAEVFSNIASGTAADDGGGGLFNNGGALILNMAFVTGNTATEGSGSGGGILNLGGTLTITGGAVSGNASARAGGGIETAGGTVTIDGTGIAENDAGTSPGNGGGLHAGGAAEVEVSNATVSQNTAVEGGGLWVSAAGTLTVTGTTVLNNTATGASADQGGGGLYSDGGTLNVVDTWVRENRATGASGSGGGILAYGGSLVVLSSNVVDNTANRAGGGIELNGANPAAMGTEVVILESEINGNDAGASPGNGGGLHAGGVSDLTLSDVAFRENTAVEGGGAWINAGGVLTALDARFTDNTATGAAADQGGGGFYNDGGEATFIGGLFQQNQATGAAGSGGGILNNAGRLAAGETEFRENTANRAGGAIEERQATVPTDMTMLLQSVRMTANDAGASPGNGGALHITGPGRVRIDSSLVDRNVASGEGGGLWNSGAGVLTVTYTTVDRNTAAVGGGLYQQDGEEGLLVFENSTSSRNSADSFGGGLAADGGAVHVTNSTLSTNTAARGGGAATRGARLLLSSATVASNTATTAGGGLANLDVPTGTLGTNPAEPESLSPDNTIVGDNTAPTGADLSGPVMSRGYNLFETTDGATVTMDEGSAADITGVDARLQPLANRGGPTETHPIDPGSPAINAGWTALLIDQRGVERRATPDIGAFESNAAPTADESFASEFAEGEEMKWSPMAPNPFGTTATAQFAVRRAQTVRIALYDVMGREVRVIHDGAMAAATAVDVEVDARGLASGVYVLVVRGESVQATQRITVAR